MEKIEYLSLIKVSGADAGSFLQGQLTNDIEHLENNWQWQGYCNPKGRLIALMQAWRVNEDYYFLIDSEILEQVSKRLQMYVLRSKVSIKPIQEIGIFARESQNTRHSLERSDDQHILGFGEQELIVDYSGAIEAKTGNQFWDYSVAAGLPHVGQLASEQFVPQMINLDLIGGINFKKGCYTGQEIVARMHYLGNLKQRMYLMDAARPKTVANNSALYNADQKKIGSVLISGQENDLALAVLRKEEIALGDTLFTDTGTELSVSKAQPYTLES